MKKLISALLLVGLMLTVLCVPAFATDKSDLLDEMAKSPVYKYISVAVENAARTVEITDEQAEKLLPIIQRAIAIVPADNGSTVYSSENGLVYSYDQVQEVLGCINEVCAIMNYTYTFDSVSFKQHAGDIVFHLYDENGALIFSYDGDVVADTGLQDSNDSYGLLAAGGALALLGVAVFVLLKKRGVAAA